MNTKGKKYMKT